MKAPVVLFTYNRPVHTKATIDALKNNSLSSETDLIVFSDGAKDEKAEPSVKAVREYIKTIKEFKQVVIIERKENFGLGNNIIEGVTEVLAQYDRLIVLEDDLLTSPYFLDYMNEGLHVYESNEKVISIHGYVYPTKRKLPETFFLRGADCLGWATWKRGWQHFEKDGARLLDQLVERNETYLFDYNNAYPYTQTLKDQIAGKNTSWAVRWYASAFLKDLYTLYPGRSLVYHNGGDGSGTNTGFDDLLAVKLSPTPVDVVPMSVQQSKVAYLAFEEFLRKFSNPGLIYRMRRKIKKLTDGRL